MKKYLKLNLIVLVLPLFMVLVVAIGFTYSLFTQNIDSNKTITMKTGDKYVGIYGENRDDLRLGNNYTFTIENRGSGLSGFEVYIESETNIDISTINYKIVGDLQSEGTLINQKVLSGNIDSGAKLTITLNLSTLSAGDYVGKIKVKTSGYTVNEPNEGDGLIPVVFDGTNWKTVDRSNLENEWYDYANGYWANAVTIKDPNKRELYKKAIPGSIVDNADINAFFVWIPRFSYTVREGYGVQVDGAVTPSKDLPGAIDVKFIDTLTTENGTGTYKDVKVDNYYTPTAFCFGDSCSTDRGNSTNIELDGIWVSKFELSGDDTNLTSIPNVSSMREKDLLEFYNLINTNMNSENGTINYGFNNNHDVHMIKNDEWSAVSILSQSKYGKYNNSSYDGVNKEVYQNKSDHFLTGCSSGSPSNDSTDNDCKYKYAEDDNGVGSSTTGNIYGVYDMSGGANEFVMANYNNNLGVLSDYALPSLKYYNLYLSNNATSACNNSVCLGQNLVYTSNWYQDKYSFVSDDKTFLTRGGSYKDDVEAGLFYVNGSDGLADKDISTRFVLIEW